MRIHIPAIPHTATSPFFNACAFTQKVRKLVRLLSSDEVKGSAQRYEIVHYGNERSDVDAAAEHVTVTPWTLLETTYGPEYWKRPFRYDREDAVGKMFSARTIEEIRRRYRPRDVILASWGVGHEPITRHFPDAIVVEPGIGYPASAVFASYRVFESYAWMNHFYGAKGLQPSWNDAVIPNYFDLDEFDFAPEKKRDSFLYIGRIQEDKGIRLYVQLAERLGFDLVIGGQGSLAALGIRPPPNVREVGFCDVETRRKLMSEARGFLLASQYCEPFGGAAVEAMLSGTPVITSDFGAFPETVLHGVTGYRCRNFEQFAWAIRNVDRIEPAACRAWAAENYSTSRVRLMFDEYFGMLQQLFIDPSGWYASKDERTELDWMKREYPTVDPPVRASAHPQSRETNHPINGHADWRTGGPADQRTNGPADQRTSGLANERTSGLANERTGGLADERTSGLAVVTALYDVGRETRGDGRKYTDYLAWFERTLTLNVPMVVFVAPEDADDVRRVRADRPTLLMARSLKEIPCWSRIDRIREILNDPSWRARMRYPGNVENRLAEYVAVIWSKFGWMKEASLAKAFGAEGLVWLDAGASRFFGPDLDTRHPWPHSSQVDRILKSDRITIETHISETGAEARRKAIPCDGDGLLGTSECLLPAGCWGGPTKAVRGLADRAEKLLGEMLSRGMIDNEQVGLALLWRRHPELFNLLHRREPFGEEWRWIEILRTLARPVLSGSAA